MIDVNPGIIARTLQGAWYSETLEHYQEEEEYYSLDFTNENDIRYAIRKWLSGGWYNDAHEMLCKESLRYAITKDGCLHANVWLPNIDDEFETPDEYKKDLNQWKVLYKQFLLILWDEWFHEPFVPADLSQYRVRIDSEFVNFPHMPELWKSPTYEPESVKEETNLTPLPAKNIQEEQRNRPNKSFIFIDLTVIAIFILLVIIKFLK